MPAKVFLAIPTIDGSICIETMLSIFKTIEYTEAQGHEVKIFPLIGDSLVSRARNFLANAFYRQPEYTHLMWVDSDLEFQPDLLLKLLGADAPLAAASYAKKRWDIQDISQKVANFKAMAGREPASIEEFSPLIVNSNLNLPASASGDYAISKGFVHVKDAATGLMLVRQDCLRMIVDAFGEQLTYYNDVGVTGASGVGGIPCDRGQRMYDFFGLMIDPVDRRLLSEDYAFCRRYSQAGGSAIPMLVSSTTAHHGRSSYRSNPLVRWTSEGAFAGRSTEPPPPQSPPPKASDEGQPGED